MIAIDKDQPPPVGKVLDTLNFRLPRGFYSSLTVVNPGSHIVVTGRALLHLLPASPDTEELGTAKSGPSADPSGISTEIRVPSAACVSETLGIFLVISDRACYCASLPPGPLKKKIILPPPPPPPLQPFVCPTFLSVQEALFSIARGRVQSTNRFKTLCHRKLSRPHWSRCTLARTLAAPRHLQSMRMEHLSCLGRSVVSGESTSATFRVKSDSFPRSTRRRSRLPLTRTLAISSN